MRQHRPGALTNHVWKSTDEGKTYSPMAEFVAGKDYALCNATVKRLASGRLLLPASPPVPGKPAETGPYAAMVLYSDDDGSTWQVSQTIVELPMRGAMEPHVEQTADGQVLMVLRSQLGKLHLSESTDDGVTWSKPCATELRAPESCPELTRIPGTNDLLLIWNNSYDAKFRSHFGKRSPSRLPCRPTADAPGSTFAISRPIRAGVLESRLPFHEGWTGGAELLDVRVSARLGDAGCH